MNKFHVRNATKSDLDAIDAVNRKCLSENYPMDTHVKWYAENPSLFWVAELPDKSIVGYVIGMIVPPRIKPTVLDARGHVVSIAVLEAFRKQGMAQSLLQHLHRALVALGVVNHVTLHVRKSNAAAQNLYKKLSYEMVTTAQKYYADGEDAFELKHNLGGDVMASDILSVIRRLEMRKV